MRRTAPVSSRAGRAVLSWRSPPLREKVTGRPWPSARTWILVENPPRERPRASLWIPLFRRPGGLRRHADERERRCCRQSAGPSRAGPRHRHPPAGLPARAATRLPGASGRSGSRRCRTGHSALEGQPRARPCAAPTGCRSGWCGGRGWGGPSGAAAAAAKAPSAAIARPSTRSVSRPLTWGFKHHS